MSRIEADTTEIRFASSQLQEAADLLGSASKSVPESVDAGDASTPVADILGRISQWSGLNADVHAVVAGLLDDIAAKIVDDEELVAEALDRISSRLGDS